MKRSDLHVDDVLYYAKPGDWDRNSTDHRGARVVVLSTEPHSWNSYSRNYVKQPRGNGVLVEFVRESTASRNPRAVVQLAHLRGPYDEVARLVDERKAADNAHRDRVADARHNVLARGEATVTRAMAAGLTTAYNATPYGTTDGKQIRVSVRADELTALLDRLAGLQAAHDHATGAIYDRPDGG